ENDKQTDDPAVLEQPRVIFHSFDQLCLFRRIAAAEFGVELAALDARHDRVRLDEEGFVSIEIRFALFKIMVEAFARAACAFHVLDEHEWPAAHYLRLGVAWILLQFGGAID